MSDIVITGGNNLDLLSWKLKALGDGGLRREMLAGIRLATKPMIAAARDSAAQRLPRSGGLADRVASSKFATRTRTSGRSAGVRVIGTSGYNIDRMDQGTVRHPVFGQDVWVDQQVSPGWFTDAMKAHSDEPRKAVVLVLENIARRIT